MIPADFFYLRAFWMLSTCRRYQGGPIPWDLIAQYAAAWNFAGDMAAHFSVIIRELDRAYIEHWCVPEAKRQAEQARREARREGKGPKGRTRTRK